MSTTNVARAGKRGNICVGNNVSATMCPRLPLPLLASFCAFFVLTNFHLFLLSFRCSYRFPHIFVDQESVCEMQDRVEAII